MKIKPGMKFFLNGPSMQTSQVPKQDQYCTISKQQFSNVT